MSLLQGCSELQETVRLFEKLMKPKNNSFSSGQQPAPGDTSAQIWSDTEKIAAMEVPADLEFRGDRLEYILSSMCRRSGLSGAVIADSKGLPLADFNSPVGGDTLAAFTSVLGNALERAATLLGESGAELISMDINYTDKIVLRRFPIENEQYFFLVICPQDLDERTEVELSIDQVTRVLTEY